MNAARLVTLEGDDVVYNSFMGGEPEEIADLLGMDFDDAIILSDREFLTGEEIDYLNRRYPEYMGIWPIIAKIGAGIIKGGIAIGKAIKNKVNAKKNATADKKAEAKRVAEQKAAAILAESERKAEQKKMLMMIGLPVLGLGALLLLKK